MIIRGPILAPQPGGAVQFITDGVLAGDARGRIEWIGEFAHFPGRGRTDLPRAGGVICPPFFDNHIHIPQHPIRGRFTEGVGVDPPGGRLLAGLNRNVFPAEAGCADAAYAASCIHGFLADTLAHGVVGGCAYMTVHADATRQALELLPASWSVGLVLMNRNCPDYLRTDDARFEQHAESLARDFGQRYVMTDRFAVAVDPVLRQRGCAVARKFDLRTQTHLNEQVAEKRFVEAELHPGRSYTAVYADDGLLAQRPILAHCIHMTDAELDLLARAESRASIAHCPTSNAMLGSGVMPLDRITDRGIDYAICTDVGASPTTSILHEMAQFLVVHRGRSSRATPSEALYRATLAPADMMGLSDRFGHLAVGFPVSFVELDVPTGALAAARDADDVIASALLRFPGGQPATAAQGALRHAINRLARGALDASPELSAIEAAVAGSVTGLDRAVRRVVVDGREVFCR